MIELSSQIIPYMPKLLRSGRSNPMILSKEKALRMSIDMYFYGHETIKKSKIMILDHIDKRDYWIWLY